jgi:hypothetical protein
MRCRGQGTGTRSGLDRYPSGRGVCRCKADRPGRQAGQQCWDTDHHISYSPLGLTVVGILCIKIAAARRALAVMNQAEPGMVADLRRHERHDDMTSIDRSMNGGSTSPLYQL